jgi:hypothetical protein
LPAAGEPNSSTGAPRGSASSNSSGSSSQLQLQHVWLRGLAHGAGATQGVRWRDPQAWALLGWAFQR